MTTIDIRSNEDRAERAFDALTEYAGDDESSAEEQVQDLLTDLRHYCSTIGASFGDLDRKAYQMYLAELEDETF